MEHEHTWKVIDIHRYHPSAIRRYMRELVCAGIFGEDGELLIPGCDALTIDTMYALDPTANYVWTVQ